VRADELAALREENLEITAKGRAIEDAARAGERAMAAKEEQQAAVIQAGVDAVEELKRELGAARQGWEEADREREAGKQAAAALEVLQKSPDTSKRTLIQAKSPDTSKRALIKAKEP